MSLSLSKLENLLASKGFMCVKFFVLYGYCFYIEVFSVKTADVFIIYIPSKYKFKISKGENVHKIQYIEINNFDNITDEYAGKQDDVDIEEIYDNNIQLSEDNDVDIENKLENNYRRPISLSDISKEDNIMIKSIYRQMRRFKYCVKKLKYKIGIIYKKYICSIRRDNSINCFVIKHYTKEHSKKLMVIVDLGTFYEKNDKLIDDVKIIRESVYKILEKNQHNNSQIINTFTEYQKDIHYIKDHINHKKIIYENMMNQLLDMLTKITTTEEKFLKELSILEQGVNGSIQDDIHKVHNRSRLEKELDNINSTKNEISRNIMYLREKKENKILTIDKISFDNAVMLNAMTKNLLNLKNL
jgi:hypothetical protein